MSKFQKCQFIQVSFLIKDLGLEIGNGLGHGILSIESGPWPQKASVDLPEFLGLPMEANQVPPLLQMLGATATVSTLVTVVGQPKTPTSAGKGGLRRGLPCLPSSDSISAVSSPGENKVFFIFNTRKEVLVTRA